MRSRRRPTSAAKEATLLRWFNPALARFEWREAPETDEVALALLEGHPDAEHTVAVYQEWRGLGAGIVASLIRAGEEAERRQRSG